MDALVWTGPRAMEMREESVPKPGAGEVLLEVAAAGICGSELGGYLGTNKLRVPPLVMGHEASARIGKGADAKLADGSPAREGVRVTFNPLLTCGECDRCRAGLSNICRKRQLIGAHRPGAFAPYVAVPAGQCWPLPDSVSDTAGAMAEPLASSIRTTAHAGLRKGDTVLVIGAGCIGLGCAAIAREAGAKVVITDLSEPRLEIAKKWGADRALHPGRDDIVAAVNEVSPGGAAAVIDAVGATQTREKALKAVVPGGRVVFVGLHDEESKLAANWVVRQEIAIVGSFAYTMEDFGQAVRMLGENRLPPLKEWLEERPLAEGKKAFDDLVDGNCRSAKIVLQIKS